MTLEHKLDRYIMGTMRDLPPDSLIIAQRDISALKYTLGTKMTDAEQKMLMAKERLDTWCLKERLRIQAIDKQLSAVKAKDVVDSDSKSEDLRLEFINSKIEYSALKNRVDGAKDVLISLAKRIGNAEQEMFESRMGRET